MNLSQKTKTLYKQGYLDRKRRFEKTWGGCPVKMKAAL